MDPKDMMKVSDNELGKLARKSKTWQVQEKGNQNVFHQLANLGRGSVLGLNELLISESVTYLTTVTCLSPEGELYKISKDIFMQKIQNTGPFVVRVKKAIEE